MLPPSKAQVLFPRLEGLSQFLEILDLNAATEIKVNREVDRHEILGVHDETVKKNYMKLAFSHHPEKNKGVGRN